MRILLTNFALEARTGAELYVYDLAVALLARGHQPVAWAPRLGRLAERLRDATVPVAADLDDLGAPPDVIHGQDNHHFLTALLRFPGVPGVRVCHGWLDERPLRFPRIRHYVCVDDTVRDRALGEWGLPAAAVSTIRNFVDLARFVQRPPLPAVPARALVFSNYAAAHAAAVQTAGTARGLAVEVVGSSVGFAADAPQSLLGGYDVVFAKGRCAIEALAVGAAVVLCDAHGLGPLGTTTNLEDLRRMNFGMRALSDRATPEAIGRVLDRYDAADARRVSDRVRAMAGLDDAVDQVLAVYERVVAQAQASPAAADDDLRALSDYLRDLAPRLQWAQSTRGLAYQILRRGYFAMQRVPGLRGVLASRARAQRLQRRLQRS